MLSLKEQILAVKKKELYGVTIRWIITPLAFLTKQELLNFLATYGTEQEPLVLDVAIEKNISIYYTLDFPYSVRCFRFFVRNERLWAFGNPIMYERNDNYQPITHVNFAIRGV